MNIKPFFVDAEIDGRVSHAKGGPKSRTGDIDLTFFQRSEGDIETAFRITTGHTYDENGDLILYSRVWHEGKMIAEHRTRY